MDFGKQLSVCFFLLIISATIVPLNLLHDHDSDSHFDRKEYLKITNPCKNVVYNVHTNVYQKLDCGHKTHLNVLLPTCELCKLIFSLSDKYVAAVDSFPKKKQIFDVCIPLYTFSYFNTSHFVIFSRGPPVV